MWYFNFFQKRVEVKNMPSFLIEEENLFSSEKDLNFLKLKKMIDLCRHNNFCYALFKNEFDSILLNLKIEDLSKQLTGDHLDFYKNIILKELSLI